MHIADALDQLAEVRRRVAMAATFRGVRASTTLATAALAIVAAITQALAIGDGVHAPYAFVFIWSGCALLCLGLVLGGVVARVRRMCSPVETSLAMSAMETLAPAMVIGALVTLIAVWFKPSYLPMLPAWWMILTSIGLFAMRRMVGRALVIPAAFFGLCGLCALVIDSPLRPHVMGGVFAIGQTLSALVLRFTVEREPGYDHGA